jgi:hypothetical protein
VRPGPSIARFAHDHTVRYRDAPWTRVRIRPGGLNAMTTHAASRRARLAAALTLLLAGGTAQAEAAPRTPTALRAPLTGHASVTRQLQHAGHRLAGDRTVSMARRVKRLRGDRLTRAEASDLLRLPLGELRREHRALRRELRRLRRLAHQGSTAPNVPPVLQSIAQCESGGNPAAIGGGGSFRGKYQFDYGTWASVGGSGDPAAAPEAEQDRRAAALYARAGPSPWPVCGG